MSRILALPCLELVLLGLLVWQNQALAEDRRSRDSVTTQQRAGQPGAATPAKSQVGELDEPRNRLPPKYGGSLSTQAIPPPSYVPQINQQNASSYEPDELIVIHKAMPEAKTFAEMVKGRNMRIKRRRNLANLQFVVTILRLPEGMTVDEAIRMLRQQAPDLMIDVNHRFSLAGIGKNEPESYAFELVDWRRGHACGEGIRLGLIDSDVDLSHPSLREQRIEHKSFLTPGVTKAKPTHATAIASLLGGNEESLTPGLLPASTLYVAGVFRQRKKRVVDTTAETITAALDWLLGKKVHAINFSITGPNNLLVQLAIQQALVRNVPVVAAAGNQGPDAPPVYPAAQAGVIAVTAVDANKKVYRKANRGEHISFAAPGVDVWAANTAGGGQYYSGTSYAVPFVVAMIATLHKRTPDEPLIRLQNRLKQTVVDLGKTGHDPDFGWGLVRASGTCFL